MREVFSPTLLGWREPLCARNNSETLLRAQIHPCTAYDIISLFPWKWDITTYGFMDGIYIITSQSPHPRLHRDYQELPVFNHGFG